MTERAQLDGLIQPECLAAQAALEAQLISDGSLDATQEAALEAHLGVCEACADFNRIARHLGKLPPETSKIESLRSVRAARTAYFRRRTRRRALLAGSAASAAAVLAMVLIPILFGASGKTDKDHGQRLAAGERLHLLDNRVTLFSSAQTQLETVLVKEDTMHVRLDHGFMCADVDPSPDHRVHFRVITPMGNVDIKGTVFAVTVSDDDVRVEVVRGKVAVDPTASDQVFSVRAGAVFDMGTRHTARMDGRSENRIRALLGISPITAETPSAAEPETRVEDISPAVSPSEESEDTASSSATKAPGEPHLPRPTLKELQEEAAKCRIDKSWRCAAERYKLIVTRFPHRPEAATALVTLGQIQLGHLDRPAEARRNFERYRKQRPSGPLSEQALYGIARANRALGDRRQERQALERFVVRHPSSPLAGTARQRLLELKKN